MIEVKPHYCEEECDSFQTHVHEFTGSVMLAEPPDTVGLLHNHRFAGVSGPVKRIKGSHVHILCTNTDFFFNHFHRIEIETGPAIPVRDDQGDVIGHIHVMDGTTSCDFLHEHDFNGTTLIENPIG